MSNSPRFTKNQLLDRDYSSDVSESKIVESCIFEEDLKIKTKTLTSRVEALSDFHIRVSQKSVREGEQLSPALPLIQHAGAHKAGRAGNQNFHHQCTKNSSSTSTTAQQATDT